MATSALAGKMQFKPGQAILAINTPATFADTVQPLPEGATLAQAGPVEAVVLFVRDSGELNRLAPQAMAALKPEGMLWIAYPKGGSGIKTDLTRDAGWEAVFAAGFQPVRQVAVDKTWSALRFKAGAQSVTGVPLDSHFAGAKADLRPIYELVAAAATWLGADVKENVRQSYIGFSRKQQFAVVRIAGRPPRLELGLRLPAGAGEEKDARLQVAGKNFGAESATHVVELGSPDEVDDQVRRWLAAAYAAA